jgi:hypothetical protein
MDEAVEVYRRLGFSMTERGYHTLGSINHLAMFGTEYLELIGVPANAARSDIMGWPIGLNGLVWGTEDADRVHAVLTEAGLDVPPPGRFSRPVALTEGTRDAAFATVRLPNATTPAGRLYFCQHFTRDLVWRDEWRQHPNGTLGVIAAVIAAADPDRLAGLFRRIFGAAAVVPVAGGARLLVGLSSFDVISPEEVGRRFGPAAPSGDGRAEYMAALVLRTASLDQAASAIAADAVERTPDRLLVPAAATMGVTLEFRI